MTFAVSFPSRLSRFCKARSNLLVEPMGQFFGRLAALVGLDIEPKSLACERPNDVHVLLLLIGETPISVFVVKAHELRVLRFGEQP